MSKQSYLQIVKTQDKRTQEAVSEYVALGELDRVITTKEDRDAWEELWQEFLHSPKWVRALSFINKYGL